MYWSGTMPFLTVVERQDVDYMDANNRTVQSLARTIADVMGCKASDVEVQFVKSTDSQNAPPVTFYVDFSVNTFKKFWRLPFRMREMHSRFEVIISQAIIGQEAWAWTIRPHLFASYGSVKKAR